MLDWKTLRERTPEMPAPNRPTALQLLLPTFLVLVSATACGSGTAVSSPSSGVPSSAPATSTPPPPPVAAKARVRFAILRDLRKASGGNGYVVTVDPARFLVAVGAEQVICRTDGGSRQACAPTPEADRLCVATHRTDPGSTACWDGYIIDNPDSTLVRIPVAASAELILRRSGPQTPTIGDLATYVRVIHQDAPVPAMYSAVRPPYGRFWLTIQNGTVVRLSQQFTP
jgi:hypothetical protein